MIFVAFVFYSPGDCPHLGEVYPALASAAGRSRRDEQAQDLPRLAPARLPAAGELKGNGAAGRERRETVRRIRAVAGAGLTIEAGEIHAFDRTERRRQDDLVQPGVRSVHPDTGIVQLNGREIQGLPSHLICHRGLARSFQITNLFGGLSIYENLRLSLQARHAMRFNIWRDIDSYPQFTPKPPN